MVACGGNFSVILGADGAIWTCAQYSSYCLGVTASFADDVAEIHDRTEPIQVLKNFFRETPVDFMAAGTFHVVAVAGGAMGAQHVCAARDSGLGACKYACTNTLYIRMYIRITYIHTHLRM